MASSSGFMLGKAETEARDRMPGRQRKSRLRAASLPGRITEAVKVMDDVVEVKPHAPSSDVLPSHCAVKVETGDGVGKPDISAGRKMVHDQSRQSRRRHASRYEYIMSIAEQTKSSLTDAVSGVGERLFHNVFKYLIDAVVASQTEEKAIEVDINSHGFDSLTSLVGREYYLEKILSLLLCMARMRVYDPPSDNEIIYYREIKKHIRCMIAYNEAKGNTKDIKFADLKDPASYHSMSCSQAISAVEELIELRGILAEINPHIWDLNHKNGSAPDVAIYVRSNFRSLPEPDWSTEKVNAFYYNKLILVLHDLKCSGLEGISPDSSEKKALNMLLDHVTSSSTHLKIVDKMASSSYTGKPFSITPRKRERETLEVFFFAPGGLADTVGLFDGRLFEYVDELRRTCSSFMLKLKMKLGAAGYPRKFPLIFGKNTDGKINQKNTTDFIDDIDQCILLASYAASLIRGIYSSVQDAFAKLTDMLRRKQLDYEFAPEALRVLSLLDCGAFRKAGDEMEIPLHAISSNNNVNGNMGSRVISLGSNADNLHTLAIILHILKDIGPLDAFVAPSSGEMVLLEKILEHVSLCIDGFLSTKAFHKERELNLAPASTLEAAMKCINKNGMLRGQPIIYFVPGKKYLVESLFKRFERVQEEVHLLIASLQDIRMLVHVN